MDSEGKWKKGTTIENEEWRMRLESTQPTRRIYFSFSEVLRRSEMDGTVKEKGVGNPFVISVIPDVDPC